MCVCGEGGGGRGGLQLIVFFSPGKARKSKWALDCGVPLGERSRCRMSILEKDYYVADVLVTFVPDIRC